MTWGVIVVYVRRIAGPVKQLVKKAQKGDRPALGKLYELFLDRIFRFVRFKVSTAEDAEDITQETFMKMWRGLKSYRDDGPPFEAWLYKIARNSVIDYYRKRKSAVPLDAIGQIADRGKTPEEITIASIGRDEALKALRKLNPDYQEIIIHKFIQEKDAGEISAIMDKPAAHIRVLQSRALNALRKAINN